MQETELKAALLTRRAKLAEQIKSLTRQLKACDTMLAGLDEESAALPDDAEVNAVLGGNSPAPATVVATAPPPPVVEAPPPPAAPAEPPAPPPPRKIGPTPEELEQLAVLARSQRRGRRMAMAEVAIARCGDTFSMRDVLEVLKHEFHWRLDEFDEDQMASAIWKAVQRRGYVLIKAGSGRTPALYGKTPPPVVVSS